MKKLISFFIGLILLLVTITAIFLAATIYDAGLQRETNVYFFQSGNLSEQRPGMPQRPDLIDDLELQKFFVAKYLHDYFSVIPDKNSIDLRKNTIRSMSRQSVFSEWIDDVLPEIDQMTNKKMLRTVHLKDIVRPIGSQYWTVSYTMKTWNQPNNFTESPTISYGTLIMKWIFEPALRPKYQSEQNKFRKDLNRGIDPATMFRFGVTEIIKQ
ncbi:MAG: hypothetical protein MJ187_02710 [Alphaproteobacteria bacterium]|nr:hypothetical protein [Alphaproteobacteria bacterium]